jgi:hypothetical protein
MDQTTALHAGATDLSRALAAAASMAEATGLTLGQADMTVKAHPSRGVPWVGVDLLDDAADTEEDRLALMREVADRVITEESRYDWDYSYDSGMRLAGADGDTTDGIRVVVRVKARPASSEVAV